MKINFVLPSIGASGGIDVVYKYVELLILRGHDVCVYKELYASNMHRYQSELKNHVHQLYCSVKAIVKKSDYQHDVDRYVWILSDKTVRDADITIATAWPTAFKVAKLSKKKGEKYYFIQDYETWDNAELVTQSYQMALNKIVISSWINNCLKRNLGIGPFPIVHNGLDLNVFHPVEVKNENHMINFLMLNHTLPKKGVKYGIEAYEKIVINHHNCKLRMFGMCGPDNLPDYVEYYQNPSKDKLLELYSMSDIFIFPSIEEGWGLTPLEAMACGCVVVGTNVGFVPELGRHKDNMMISAPGDVDTMVDNINEIIKKPELNKKIQSGAYKLVRMLDWSVSAEEFERCLLSSNRLEEERGEV